MLNKFKTKAKVWLYPGKAAWHFVTIPKELSMNIKELFSDQERGWGSLPIKVTINETSWDTSIFYDKKSNGYLLPIKSLIRKKEDISVDDVIEFSFEIK